MKNIGTLFGSRGPGFSSIRLAVCVVAVLVCGAWFVPVARGGIEQEIIVGFRGDVNGSGAVNITDVIHLNAYLFEGGPAPVCVAAADADSDGAVSSTDSAFLLNWLFAGGPAPSPTYFTCEF